MVSAITIHFIRHAPTAGNEKRQYIGWTDESIVKATSILPINLETQLVIGSDLKRCEQTANCYFPNAKFKGFEGFREMHFGDFEGKTYDELKNFAVYRAWIDEPFVVKPPNGEDFAMFEERVLAAFRALKLESEQYFVLHGGVIRLLLMHFAPEKQDFWAWQVPHHTLFSLTWQQENMLKGGQRCTSLSVVPIMANGHM